MANNLAKAEFWRDFILQRCRYPALTRLEAQFRDAVLRDFCQCWCNGFAVVPSPGTIPMAKAGAGGMVFEASLPIDNAQTIEIALMTDEAGCLTYVDVICVGNNFPVPDTIQMAGEISHLWVSDKLLIP